jgi:FkbM family methyltransferase
MLVIYPFSTADQKQALKNAQWISELGGCKGHDIFVLADRRCDVPLGQEINNLFVAAFRVAQFRWTKADVDGWPQGANHMFGYATTLIQFTEEWPYFLWLEPDAIPITPGWLDKLEAEYKRGGKPFMGEKVDLGEKRPDVPIHMSGVAIYPNPIYMHAGECCRAHDVAWDIAAKDQILPKAHFTGLIQHYWKHGTFTSLDGLRPETVLFHSSKDGSLIDILRAQRNGEVRDGAAVARLAHNQEAVGSIPTPAIKVLPHSGVWVLEGDTIISDQVEREGRLDFDPLLPHVLPLIRPGDTVLDVGAFIGDHTVAYAHAVGKAGKVIAYEPNPTAFQCLVHNTEKFGNVFTFRTALSCGREEVKLTQLDNAASNYINKEIGTPVHTRALDEDMSLFGELQLIKIDVEGYEVKVLEGAEKLIEKFQPQMVIEINEIAMQRQAAIPQDIVDWLAWHGYSSKILHRHKDAPFYDILALPRTPPEIRPSAAMPAHIQASAPPVVVVPFTKETVYDYIEFLKDFAEQSAGNKAIVSSRLVYAGLREPNKKKKWKPKKTKEPTKASAIL